MKREGNRGREWEKGRERRARMVIGKGEESIGGKGEVEGGGEGARIGNGKDRGGGGEGKEKRKRMGAENGEGILEGEGKMVGMSGQKVEWVGERERKRKVRPEGRKGRRGRGSERKGQ